MICVTTSVPGIFALQQLSPNSVSLLLPTSQQANYSLGCASLTLASRPEFSPARIPHRISTILNNSCSTVGSELGLAKKERHRIIPRSTVYFLSPPPASHPTIPPPPPPPSLNFPSIPFFSLSSFSFLEFNSISLLLPSPPLPSYLLSKSTYLISLSYFYTPYLISSLPLSPSYLYIFSLLPIL
ncbi:hypothetical protein ASPWEDRAFT_465555 [Aspergillus wentii DTO 134E9]|uniref:Uncharacterized protein n=1 Tax=Aspergillus wentii DTO 134E9 TaxID=1073089 RepID=A0A1L9RRT9_ASPWE|nr:uncharacterized protein ASPWEDRAFT_465555 [Aspergillus wentii DTO 134E9]OJJ37686.1 hypothetical protein ASPWEDRAFT_465555 [Aspergillus wentii DTO 134E9]